MDAQPLLAAHPSTEAQPVIEVQPLWGDEPLMEAHTLTRAQPLMEAQPLMKAQAVTEQAVTEAQPSCGVNASDPEKKQVERAQAGAAKTKHSEAVDLAEAATTAAVVGHANAAVGLWRPIGQSGADRWCAAGLLGGATM